MVFWVDEQATLGCLKVYYWYRGVGLAENNAEIQGMLSGTFEALQGVSW